MLSRGIVLERFFPEKNSVAMLDLTYGSVRASAPESVLDFLWPGMVVNSVICTKKYHFFFLKEVKREVVPVGMDISTLGWFRLLVRFCYLLLPAGMVCDKSFYVLEAVAGGALSSLEGSLLKQVQRGCVMFLLKVNGIAFGVKVERYSSLFESYLRSKSLVGGNFGDLKLSGSDVSLLLNQVESGAGKDLVQLLLKLLTLNF